MEYAGERSLIVVADGAGGTGGAALAAEGVCDAVVDMFRGGSADSWDRQLARIDSLLSAAGHGGLSTAVVVEIAGGHITGASVGDSGAWLVQGGVIIDLTDQQIRKPLLGSGAARPVAFGPVPLRGRLVVATDGLFKYAARAQIASVATRGAPDLATAALVDAVRMKNGALQDDVAVVVCDGTG